MKSSPVALKMGLRKMSPLDLALELWASFNGHSVKTQLSQQLRAAAAWGFGFAFK